MINRYIDATYCDDIRHENTGKMILVGVYSSTMYVASYPTTLPKLCISIRAVTPADTPFEKVVMRIYRDEELLLEVPADPDRLMVNSLEDAKSSGSNTGVQALQFLATISPFQLTNDCVIRVKAETESEELRCPVLKVEQAQSPSSE